MKKIFLLISLCFCAMAVTAAASAQLPHLPKILVFGNFTYANPVSGSFKNSYNNGTGFEVGGGIGFKKTIVYASTGYMNYSAAGNNTIPGNLQVTPVKLGVRRYLIGNLFVNGALGLAFQSYSNSSTTGNNFLYEAGAGIKLLFFEFGAAYTGYNQPVGGMAGSFLMKVGISFKI